MALTAQDVAKLADLARIELTEEELARLAPQMDEILASMATLAEAIDDDVPPMSHAVPLVNVFRDDQVRPSYPASAMLAAAPAVEENQFRVPRILDAEE
ncbi:Asp-tRNA(Asn)/Glu-tRNA(Gln) amidotransferase subunit GatC [Brooklawnia sp.]|uniref:Asp-tRNA(Asn)/Glu-tRNA(Gln) amidotransferase subunit GatC n=1 Tax=Brooklawnia sp. TaxID=2699740 RepID=UPI00311FC4DA